MRLFEVLSEGTDTGVVIHCTTGKDRTGVSTAFFLAVPGVDRSMIEADYLLTNRDVHRQADFIEQTTGFPDDICRDTMIRLAGVPETAMKDFLDGVYRQWGGPVEFLLDAGVNRGCPG